MDELPSENKGILESTLKYLSRKCMVEKMPKFALYSLLDKNLLKSLLIKVTEITDDQIDGIRQKYGILESIRKDK